MLCFTVCYPKIERLRYTKLQILPVLLYGSLIMREKRRLKMSESRAFRILLGPERDEVRREWRKLHNEELYAQYCSPKIVRGDKINKNEMGGACSAYGGIGEAYTGFW
jgi:hypothetical protein